MNIRRAALLAGLAAPAAAVAVAAVVPVADPGVRGGEVALAASPMEFWNGLNVLGWPATGDRTNLVETGSTISYDQTYSYTPAEYYSLHASYASEFLYNTGRSEVFDSHTDKISDGAVITSYSALPLYPGPVGALSLFGGTHVADPVYGTTDQFWILGIGQNVYVSNTAGIEDQFFLGGQPITLFSFPAAGAEMSPMAQAVADGLFGPDVTSTSDLTTLFDAIG